MSWNKSVPSICINLKFKHSGKSVTLRLTKMHLSGSYIAYTMHIVGEIHNFVLPSISFLADTKVEL